MKASRITAVGLVAAAALWIASGHLIPHETAESRASQRPNETAEKLFRVGVIETNVVQHSRKLLLSGRTEADKKVAAFARTGGVLTELRVKRGTHVKKGDIIAILSDEAREAQVMQAKALLEQRKIELEAKRRLIELNAVPRLELSNLEAQHRAAVAAVAAAEAERDRGIITAPWDGVVTEVSGEVGASAFSFSGTSIAQIVALDPMLAVVEVAERKLAGVKLGETADVRLVTGQTATGHVRFVSKSASQTTRTYRVEVEIKNPDGAIPDGITAEVMIPVAPMAATRVPRSALTFSSKGELGVRTVSAEGIVGFLPISVVEDDQAFMWVGGLPNGTRVIVQGQDFVREGQKVDAVPAPEQTAVR
ncbi:MAG: efflux RND transporter periplasmic adaptor subunit [Pseudomonadota bacterium]